MMDCGKAKEYIDLYIDGRLTSEQTDQLLLHTQSCSACRKELESAIALKRSFDELPELEPPEGLAASAIKKAKKRKVPFYAYATAGVAIVAAMVAVFASGVVGQRSPNDGLYKSTADAEIFETTEDAGFSGGAQNAASSETVEDSVAMDMPASDDGAESEDGAGSDSCADEEGIEEEAMIPECKVIVYPQEAEAFRPALDDFFETNGMVPEYVRCESTEEVLFYIEEPFLEELETLLLSYDIEYEGELIPGAILTIEFASE